MQVIFLAAKRATLLERVKHRRVDAARGYEPFHVPPDATSTNANATKSGGAGAAGGVGAQAVDKAHVSPPLLPLDANGAVDKARLAALVPRHDDSRENVLERLRLWDLHADDVRCCIALVVPWFGGLHCYCLQVKAHASRVRRVHYCLQFAGLHVEGMWGAAAL